MFLRLHLCVAFQTLLLVMRANSISSKESLSTVKEKKEKVLVSHVQLFVTPWTV